LLRDDQGKLPTEWSLKLPIASERDWSCLGVGDFNGDGRPDVPLSSYGQGPVRTAVYYNTGQTDRPFAKSPTVTLDLDTLTGDKQIKGPLLRDSIPAADFNGDGHGSFALPPAVIGSSRTRIMSTVSSTSFYFTDRHSGSFRWPS
jgi:hypothetical protein